jgi:hypothetical protein
VDIEILACAGTRYSIGTQPIECRTGEQMKLVTARCRFAEAAEPIATYR